MVLAPWIRRTLSVLAILLLAAVLRMVGILLWASHGADEGAPRIGLSVSDEWFDDLGFHRVPYDLALARAGAEVVSLRPSDHADRLPEVLPDLDGLLFAGGGDIDPSVYAGEAGERSLLDPERDRFELDLLRRAEARGLPVVGICRGIQVLVVAHGGSLRYLRTDEELSWTHGITLESMSAHDVNVLPGSRLAGVVGAKRHRVNSTHFFAVSDPGSLSVCARSPDGVVEAVELPGPRLVLGIQWHPELLGVLDETQQAIIEELVSAARTFREGR